MLQALPASLWVRLLLTDLGLYVHIPFCASKCSYCGFYSFSADENLQERYTEKLIEEINIRGVLSVRPVKSLYIGGGTPTVLGTDRLCRIITACYESFNILPDAEITIEANPADDLSELLKNVAKAGVNRLSLGVQSANDDELKILGRRQNNSDVVRTVRDARAAGIENISLDLMLGIPKQTEESFKKSIDFCLSQEPEHISAYILSLEEGTPLANSDYASLIPDDEGVARLYEQLCDEMTKAGFSHYEISNFAKKGFESRHNSHYWQCGEYIGIGPSAHSFYNGKRFYCQSCINEFLDKPSYIDDGPGGDKTERIMLGLRLKEGVDFAKIERDFSVDTTPILKKARELEKQKLVNIKNNTVSLTEKGMLVSNSIISSLIYEVDL